LTFTSQPASCNTPARNASSAFFASFASICRAIWPVRSESFVRANGEDHVPLAPLGLQDIAKPGEDVRIVVHKQDSFQGVRCLSHVLPMPLAVDGLPIRLLGLSPLSTFSHAGYIGRTSTGLTRRQCVGDRRSLGIG
jgi:hypothetical protein